MDKILNIAFDNLTKEEILEKVKKAVETGNKLQIITLNTEMIIKAQTDKKFSSVIKQAGLVVPESSGLVLASNYQDNHSPFKILKLLRAGFKTVLGNSSNIKRIAGVDLAVALAGLCSEFGYKLVLLGGKEGVAQKASNELRQRFSNLNVVGLYGGEVGKDNEKILAEVKEAGGDVILVAFGHGKQEMWLAENLEKIAPKVGMGVGGSLDFIAKASKRAPVWVQKMGMEWSYRLLHEPWRLKRQLSLIKFIGLLLKS